MSTRCTSASWALAARTVMPVLGCESFTLSSILSSCASDTGSVIWPRCASDNTMFSTPRAFSGLTSAMRDTAALAVNEAAGLRLTKHVLRGRARRSLASGRRTEANAALRCCSAALRRAARGSGQHRTRAARGTRVAEPPRRRTACAPPRPPRLLDLLAPAPSRRTRARVHTQRAVAQGWAAATRAAHPVLLAELRKAPLADGL